MKKKLGASEEGEEREGGRRGGEKYGEWGAAEREGEKGGVVGITSNFKMLR